MCKEQRPAGTHQGQCHIDPKLRKRTPRRHAAGDCGDPPRQPVETRPPMFRRPWSEGFMNMPRALTRERDGRWRCAWLHVPFVSLSCPVDRVLDTDTEGLPVRDSSLFVHMQAWAHTAAPTRFVAVPPVTEPVPMINVYVVYPDLATHVLAVTLSILSVYCSREVFAVARSTATHLGRLGVGRSWPVERDDGDPVRDVVPHELCVHVPHLSAHRGTLSQI